MDSGLVAFVLSLFVILLVLRTPIAFALAISGAAGTLLLRGPQVALRGISDVSFSGSSQLSVVEASLTVGVSGG